MKILITGAAGFVGSHLSEYFLNRGEQVVGMDAAPYDANNYLWPHRENRRFSYFCDSILNEGLMRHLIRESETVYHLAATVGLGNVIGQVLQCIEINVRGTAIVLGLAAEYKKRVLLTSTSEIAGKSAAVPLSENDDRILGPTTVDRWVYSETKALGEYMSLAYCQAGLPVSIVRLFNVYGPRLDKEGNGRVITRFMRQVLDGHEVTIIGDGNQTRAFTYITDIVRGIVAAGEKPEAVGGIFNLGTTVETSINELVDAIFRATGKRAPIRHVDAYELYGPGYEDTLRRAPNIERARRILGFQPTVALEEGIGSTLEWLQTTLRVPVQA